LRLPGALSLAGVEAAIARHERAAVYAIFAAATLLQINAILHHGYMGQDYGSSAYTAAQAVALPAPAWIVYVGTNPPALFWLTGLVHWATGTASYVAATSFVFVIANTLALWLWWRLSQAIIRAPSLRVAAMLTLAFLPVRLIHSVVFAGDAVVVLPFTLAIWFSYELLRATEPRRQLELVLALSAALVVSISSKYTMASSLAVIAVFLLVLQRVFPSRRILAAAAVLVLIVPGLFAVYYHHVYTHLPGTDTRRVFWGHDMDWRSLLTLRAHDVDVLRAPLYIDRIRLAGAETYNLLVPNRHSYAALLHYSVFTDPLNIFQYDPTDNYFGARDDLHQRLMALSVNLALPLSLLMIGATAVYLFRALSYLRALRAGALDQRLPILLVLLFSVMFFANIALFLPYVQQAYYCGYWTARLVLPALLGFGTLGFALLDERLHWRGARLGVLAYAAVQAALHVSFLWVRGA
jgi:hypothetical protein